MRRLDLENRRCFVETADTDYYTDSIVKTDIKVLQQDEEGRAAGVRTVLGDILVRTQATKFKKLKYHTHENIGYGDITLPPDEMHTRSAMLVFDDGSPAGRIFSALPEEQKGPVMRRLGNLARTVAPVFLLCDPRDIGVSERVKDPHFDSPTLFVYDQYPGGIGLSEGFLKNLSAVLTSAAEVVEQCPCQDGCPSCIGPPEEDLPSGGAGGRGEGTVAGAPLGAKNAVRAFLSAWLSQREQPRGEAD